MEKPVLTIREAVETFVPDGQELLIGGFAFSDPTAFAHELIRQKRTNLYIMKTSGGVLLDMLIGAGVVDKLLCCHIWNSVGPVAAHCFRRAMEKEIPHPIEIEELSYGAFTTALMAGACGFPFMPTTPVAGTGHFTKRTFLPNKFALIDNPFDTGQVSLVAPVKPALGVFHVHRVDKLGNTQVFGPLGEMRHAMAACRKLIVIAEELVDTDEIRKRPESTVAPGFMVDAIVVEPFSAHPVDAYGYYLRDLEHNQLYGRMTKTVEGFEEYLNLWVRGTKNHAEFLGRLGDDRLEKLRVDALW